MSKDPTSGADEAGRESYTHNEEWAGLILLSQCSPTCWELETATKGPEGAEASEALGHGC